MPTRRHTYTWQCLILLIAGTVYGQWDTNAWPAYMHPRSQKSQYTQCWTALTERAVAAYDHTNSYPVAPAWYRFQRGNLIELKKGFRRLLGEETGTGTHNLPVGGRRWVNKGTATSGLLASVRETGQIFAFTKQALCAYAKRPTNYFDYTPYRGLDGVGPFTNDVSVGHPHGWTNEYTAAGGANYPEGRSCWYTTDYGIDGIRDMVTNLDELVYMHTGTSSNNTIDGNSYNLSGTSIVCYGATDFTKDLSKAKSQAESTYTNITYFPASINSYPGQYSAIYKANETNYYCRLYSASNGVEATGPMDYSYSQTSNLFAKIVSSKMFIQLVSEEQGFGFDEEFFDGHTAFPDRSNVWQEVSATVKEARFDAGMYTLSAGVGDLQKPYWGQEPESNATSRVYSWMFEMYVSKFWMYAKYDFDFK